MHLVKSLSVFALLSLGNYALASEWIQYSAQAFTTAQEAGKTVVLDFHADWCSTCKKQEPLLKSILKKEAFNEVVGLKVNFDQENELKEKLKVIKQSTLVVFKGGQEIERKMGLTNQAEIEALFTRGLK